MKPIPKPRRLARSRIAEFVRRLLARYARARAARRAVDFALVNAQPALVQYVLRRHAVFPAPPRSPRAALASRPGGAPAALESERDARVTRNERLEGRPRAARAGRHAVLLRIVQRAERVDARLKDSPPAPGRAAAARIADEVRQAGAARLPFVVPAVMGRSAAAPSATVPDPACAPASVERAPAAPGAAGSNGGPSAAPRALPALAVPEQEIERLAERVIGTIDRRIAARRERLGRP